MLLTIEIDLLEFQGLMECCPSQYWAEVKYRKEKVIVREHGDGQPGDWIELTDELRAKGLALMATKAPKHFGNFVTGNWDGDTSDIWLQLTVLGEIKYG